METNTTHSVYAHPDGRREVIKNGFSWSALIFGPLWAWRKGMVSLGFGLLAIHVSLQLIPLLFIDIWAERGILVDLVITLIVLGWIGGRGNAWLRHSLLNLGFTPVPASVPAERGAAQPIN